MVYGPAGARGRADDLLATWVATRLAGSRGCHGVRGDLDILLYTTGHRPPVQTVYEPRVTMTDRWHGYEPITILNKSGLCRRAWGTTANLFLKAAVYEPRAAVADGWPGQQGLGPRRTTARPAPGYPPGTSIRVWAGREMPRSLGVRVSAGSGPPGPARSDRTVGASGQPRVRPPDGPAQTRTEAPGVTGRASPYRGRAGPHRNGPRPYHLAPHRPIWLSRASAGATPPTPAAPPPSSPPPPP